MLNDHLLFCNYFTHIYQINTFPHHLNSQSTLRIGVPVFQDKSSDICYNISDRSTLAELRRARVCVSDFEMIQLIGRGHYGEVHVRFNLLTSIHRYEPKDPSELFTINLFHRKKCSVN